MFSLHEKKSFVCVVVASSTERERFSFQSLSKSRRRRRVVVHDSVPGRRLFNILVREKRERERGKDDDEGF